MDWITIIVGAACSLIGAFGGGSVLYFQQNKKLKSLEVIHNQADEWKRLYDEADTERKEKDVKLDKMREERDSAKSDSAHKDLDIQKLRWYHCTCNGCKNRRPPHVFDMDGNELEAQQQK